VGFTLPRALFGKGARFVLVFKRIGCIASPDVRNQPVKIFCEQAIVNSVAAVAALTYDCKAWLAWPSALPATNSAPCKSNANLCGGFAVSEACKRHIM
jgi:hypothetical protein